MARRELVIRMLPVGITLAMLIVTACLMAQTVLEDPGRIGQDFRFYRDVGERWLSSGAFYLPRQLEGEYQLGLMVDVLYPPTALLLFVPLALLPGLIDILVWWGVPAALLAWYIHQVRPSPWTWPVAALLLLWPRSWGSVLWGNTDIWVMAAVSAGLLWGWPALLTVLKPSFAPLALVGVRHRSWWVGGIALLIVSAVALPLWLDYARALLSVRGLGLDYSLFNLPISLIPIALHLGRRRERDAAEASPAMASTAPASTVRSP